MNINQLINQYIESEVKVIAFFGPSAETALAQMETGNKKAAVLIHDCSNNGVDAAIDILILCGIPVKNYSDDDFSWINGLSPKRMLMIVLDSNLYPYTERNAVLIHRDLLKYGILPVTESVLYAVGVSDSDMLLRVGYRQRWEMIKNLGYPLSAEYKLDGLYQHIPRDDQPYYRTFLEDEGDLQGITVLGYEWYMNAFYEHGNYDTEQHKCIFDDKVDSNVIFDVGGFIGISSLIYARELGEDAKIIAFEPNPFNRQRFFMNISANAHLMERIRCYPYALGENNGTIVMNMSMEVDNGHSSTSRIAESHATIQDSQLPQDFYECEVHVRQLDAFVEETGIVPGRIKVDIEGAETMFLRGALRTLRKYHPIIYMEVHSQWCAVECTELLISLDYSISILHEEEDNRIMIRAAHTQQAEGDDSAQQIPSMWYNKFCQQQTITVQMMELLKQQRYDYDGINSVLNKKLVHAEQKYELSEQQHQMLLSQVMEKNEEIVELSKKLFHEEKARVDVALRLQQAEEKQGVLSVSNGELKERLSGLNEKLLLLEQERANLRIENSELQQQISGLTEKQLLLEQERASLQTENSDLKLQISGLTEKQLLLERERASMQTENNELKLQISGLTEKQLLMEQERANLQIENSDLKLQISGLMEKQLLMGQERANLLDECDALKLNVSDLEKKCVALELGNTDLLAACETLKHENSAMQPYIDELQAIKKSKSWRWMQPLKKMRGAFSVKRKAHGAE